MKEERLEILFQRYLNRDSSPAEESELMELLLDPELEAKRAELIDIAYEQLPEKYIMTEAQGDRIFQQVTGHHADVVKMKKSKIFNIRRIAVAASVLFILVLGSYFLFFNKSTQKDIVKLTDPVVNDIAAPTGNKAVIRLADGRIIQLDSIGNGTLATQGNVNVSKTKDGKIIYSALRQTQGDMQYNTLTNPRGSSVIDMTLADGSRVWLNAGSSVTYPVTFIGKERKVSIAGEAYFEVTHNAKMPFKVTKGEMEVTVLGTHFNVNAYDDEDDIKVTLLEGKVNVSDGNQLQMIKPGQQAVVSGGIRIVDDADLEQVMSWKNGLFQFNSASLQEVMREIARWYDVEVSYESNILPQKFGGGISRNPKLSEVLEILKTSGVKFEIEGKKVTVMP